MVKLSSEWLSNFSKVTQLVSDQTGIQAPVPLTSRHMQDRHCHGCIWGTGVRLDSTSSFQFVVFEFLNLQGVASGDTLWRLGGWSDPFSWRSLIWSLSCMEALPQVFVVKKVLVKKSMLETSGRISALVALVLMFPEPKEFCSSKPALVNLIAAGVTNSFLGRAWPAVGYSWAVPQRGHWALKLTEC